MPQLDARHATAMILVAVPAALAFALLPQHAPVYDATAYAFLLIGGAAFLGILGSASIDRRTAWMVAAWVVLVSAALVALWPLRPVLANLRLDVGVWREAGHPLARALWESLSRMDDYPELVLRALGMTFVVGVAALFGALAFPVLGFRATRIGADRQAKGGPWTATWMPPHQVAELAANRTGLPLARHQGRVLRYRKDDAKSWRGGHHAVIAGTRGFKGVSAVVPALLEHQGPVACLNIKGENFAVTRRHRRSLGRTVAVLNPFGVVEPSRDCFNPLDYVRPEELTRDVDLLADGAHFAEMARLLVAAAIEVVLTQEEPERRTLVAVADLLLSGGFDATLQAWVDNEDLIGRRPAQVAATILRTGDRERGSIQTAVSKAFAWMASDPMRRFLGASSFDLDDLLEDKLDLFVVVPLDQLEKQAVFMRLFVNLVLGTVVRQHGRRKVKAPILLALDEFVRLGRMEQIVNVANVAAGAGIEALFVTQDLGQLQKAYGKNDADSILGSCVTKRVFNLGDVATAEWVTRHLGEATVYAQQRREPPPPRTRSRPRDLLRRAEARPHDPR
jgi:type IV secretion system protein VirD4